MRISKDWEVIEAVDSHYRLNRVAIDGLFGYLDYYISTNEGMSSSDVSILYGDNAAGKTSIMKLVYHILSPSNISGHRNFVFNTDFNFIMVELRDKSSGKFLTITVSRSAAGNYNSGDFKTIVRNSDGVILLEFDTDDVDRNGIDIVVAEKYSKIILNLGIPVYFLSTERHIRSDYSFVPISQRYNVELGIDQLKKRKKESEQIIENSTNFIIETTYNWIISKAFQVLNESNDSSDEAYIEILERINSKESIALDGNLSAVDLSNTLDYLKSIKEFRNSLSYLGNINLNIDRSLDLLSDIYSRKNLQEINANYYVIGPHLHSIRKRFEAVKPLISSVQSFFRGLNDLLVDKTVYLLSGHGIVFKHKRTNKLLGGSDLSSGETQIIRIFCHSLVSTDSNSIFLIDEPELSLNIKWQRKLIPYLLEISSSKNTQYIFATHSMEILAQRLNDVVKLEDLSVRS